MTYKVGRQFQNLTGFGCSEVSVIWCRMLNTFFTVNSAESNESIKDEKLTLELLTCIVIGPLSLE